MAGDAGRTIILHLVALNLLTAAACVCLSFPDSPALHFVACLSVVAISAFAGKDHHIGFAATAYAVVVLALLSRPRAEFASLGAFAVTGVSLAAALRAVHADHTSGRRMPLSAMIVTIGLALLALLTYTDVSDLFMRIAAVPSILQVLIVLLALVVLALWRRTRPLEAVRQPVVLAFTLYGLIVFTTSIWARNASLVDARFAEIVKALLICVLTASLAFSWKALRSAMTAVVVAATVFSATSIAQVTTGRFFGAFGGLLTPQSGTLYEHLAMPRASGPPNSDPNFYARILLLAIPLALGLAIAGRTRATRAACYSAAAIITVATLLTYSRGAMVALAGTALLLVAGLDVRAPRIAGAAVIVIVALLFVPTDVARRFQTLMPAVSQGDPDSALEKRKLLARTGLAMLEAHPLTGVGAGHFGRYYWSFAGEIGSSRIDYHVPGTMESSHGLFLEIGAETGLLGLAAFVGVIVAALSLLERARYEAYLRGNRELEIISLALLASICGYLAASVFLHETHYRYLGLYFGFAIATARLVRSWRCAPVR